MTNQPRIATERLNALQNCAPSILNTHSAILSQNHNHAERQLKYIIIVESKMVVPTAFTFAYTNSDDIFRSKKQLLFHLFLWKNNSRKVDPSNKSK